MSDVSKLRIMAKATKEIKRHTIKSQVKDMIRQYYQGGSVTVVGLPNDDEGDDNDGVPTK